MCGCCVERLLGYFGCRVIKLLACLCQVGTSAHLITDKWGFVPASVRINPFCKHSYPNLLNMPLCTSVMHKYCSFYVVLSCFMQAERHWRAEEIEKVSRCPKWLKRTEASQHTYNLQMHIHEAPSSFCCLPSQQSQNTWWGLAVPCLGREGRWTEAMAGTGTCEGWLTFPSVARAGNYREEERPQQRTIC